MYIRTDTLFPYTTLFRSEHLNRLNVKTNQIEELIDEMSEAQLNTFKKLYLKDRMIKNIIVVDDYLSVWISKRVRKNTEKGIVNIEEYKHFMDNMSEKPLHEIAKLLDISVEAAPLTFISSCLMKRIMNLMGAEKLWQPCVTLCDGIAYEYAEQHTMLQIGRAHG